MITLKIQADFGDDVYLKKDSEQVSYTLVGIYRGPGHTIYKLSSGIDEFDAYDFECSFVRDEALRLSFNNNDD